MSSTSDADQAALDCVSEAIEHLENSLLSDYVGSLAILKAIRLEIHSVIDRGERM